MAFFKNCRHSQVIPCVLGLLTFLVHQNDLHVKAKLFFYFVKTYPNDYLLLCFN